MQLSAIGLAAVIVCASGPAAAGLCGSTDDQHAVMGIIADYAWRVCDGVREIPANDLGVMLGSARVDVREPACAREAGLVTLRLKTESERDLLGWCRKAKDLMAAHPITAPLVKAAAPKPAAACGEIDKAGAIVASARERCGYKVTPAGEVMIKLSRTPACHEQVAADHEQRIAQRQPVLKTRERAVASWCASLLGEHQQQMRGIGLPVWFSR